MAKAEKTEMPFRILAYLSANPAAQDTLEGVAEWWLLEQRIKEHTAEVKAALDELVSRGLVLERTGKDKRSHYRVNRSRLAEIARAIELRSWPGETNGRRPRGRCDENGGA
jgi:hypothetical protein